MKLHLWAGLECTVNRIGDRYFDQVKRSGHHWRNEDLDLFAGLGIRTLRYPVLWERTAPDGVPDWRWPDERLLRLRQLGIRPIVGLMHHGSGPRFTSLIDANFPAQFAAYAQAVAERYPWVEDYTPVNEPLTTARFSGLYGHWYPHGRDDATFAQAFVGQCKAIVLAMRAIRSVNPNARLVQTEDFGKVFSTPELAYQAEFENHRRWLTYDLLCGCVDRNHPMRGYLLKAEVPERDLAWFEENACTPDLIGMNHYVTSDRYLDGDVDRYPPATHGGNGRQRYADVEAVRVHLDAELGPEARIRETWERYHLPMAITEAHLGCSPDEQLRWLRDVWEAAERQHRAGVDIRAVTAWALLGSFDWDSLLTQQNGSYEPGVFDVRTNPPEPAALAAMLRVLARGGRPDHPHLEEQGWWLRPERIFYYPGYEERRAAV